PEHSRAAASRGRDQVADWAGVRPCCAHASSRERQAMVSIKGVSHGLVPLGYKQGLSGIGMLKTPGEEGIYPQVTRRTPPVYPSYAVLPNSPSLAPSRKASHSARVKTRAGPSGNLELRTAISPAGSCAASTQLPLGLL